MNTPRVLDLRKRFKRRFWTRPLNINSSEPIEYISFLTDHCNVHKRTIILVSSLIYPTTSFHTRHHCKYIISHKISDKGAGPHPWRTACMSVSESPALSAVRTYAPDVDQFLYTNTEVLVDTWPVGANRGQKRASLGTKRHAVLVASGLRPPESST